MAWDLSRQGKGLKCVKMIMNCDYDSVVDVILPVENKILLVVRTPRIEIDKHTPTFLRFLPKTQRLIFASGKNGRTLLLGCYSTLYLLFPVQTGVGPNCGCIRNGWRCGTCCWYVTPVCLN